MNGKTSKLWRKVEKFTQVPAKAMKKGYKIAIQRGIRMEYLNECKQLVRDYEGGLHSGDKKTS